MSNIIPNAAQTYIATMPATIATPRQTMMEVMQILSAHTADVFVKVLQILSCKYGHSVDEMLDVIRTHPDYHSLHVPPVLTSQFYQAPVTVGVDKKTRGRPKKGSGAPIAVPITSVVPIVVPQADNHIVPSVAPIAAPIVPTQAPIVPTQAPIVPTQAPKVVIAVPITSVASQADNDIVPIAAPIAPIVAKKKIYKIKSKVPSQDQELVAVDTKEVIPHTY
jgi:hypothetical protein